ncbi:VWA domain-containing protein [Sneathiella sp. P13V-1]|uniref:VWA domain-containing protein n=1 Tax=Sneathiella sp. P13V-1 TaxID=2697366 RepID=UPI00187B5BD1|nr:VWA domain-containing protein [Sneathiella sp. P13V-1]MBE7638667.1 VWA domain-containing protein [Sneathiella sp. P13V-1]
MRRRRETEGFNLSFLDIMACGLGAAVLILILLKLQPEEDPIDIDALIKELGARQEQKAALDKEALGQEKKLSELKSELAKLLQNNQELAKELQDISQTNDDIKKEVDEVKERIINKPPLKKDDVVQSDEGGEEEYLMGLKVEGRRIAFLIDTSASMTDERLVDIIGRKTGSDTEKQKGPKWQRTKRIVKWLANRIPKGSEAYFLGFSEKVNPIGPSDWFKGADTSSVQQVFDEMDQIVPSGGTNLEGALDAAKKLSGRPTNYYVVTDGLPTKGTSNFKSLNPFAKCSALFGKSSTISGNCRSRLFVHTVKKAGFTRRTPLNVVLLPLEGDPEAAPLMWAWTYSTGGLMISPAVSWP